MKTLFALLTATLLLNGCTLNDPLLENNFDREETLEKDLAAEESSVVEINS